MSGLSVNRQQVWESARAVGHTTGAVVESLVKFLGVVLWIAAAGTAAVFLVGKIISLPDPVALQTPHHVEAMRATCLGLLTVAEGYLVFGFRALGDWCKSLPKTFAKREA